MTITVDELAVIMKNSMNNIKNLKVTGEIGRVTKAASGHLYFDLRSTTSNISCVAWSSYNIFVKSGVAELTIKNVDFYPPHGKCQAIVTEVNQCDDEVAKIAECRAKLIENLQKEGVLSRCRLEIPDVINHICIITSNGSAACHDMKQGIESRWPNMRTTIIHASVQGFAASESISDAFILAYKLKPDVIICGRGGGSEADLNIFNEEKVVRSFVNSEIPVISAIGHENDHCVSDLVADIRAKTPTASIELAIKLTKFECDECLSNMKNRLFQQYNNTISRLNEKNLNSKNLLKILVSHKLKSAEEKNIQINIFLREALNKGLLKHKQYVNNLSFTNLQYMKNNFDLQNNKLNELKSALKSTMAQFILKSETNIQYSKCRLDAYSPNHTLKRGFGLISSNDIIIRSITSLNEGDTIRVKLHDGIFEAIVKRCRME
tara:strand:- start:233 stop:1537 length:1305 start_codon:yes stop_codon:yes gene_type:complete